MYDALVSFAYTRGHIQAVRNPPKGSTWCAQVNKGTIVHGQLEGQLVLSPKKSNPSLDHSLRQTVPGLLYMARPSQPAALRESATAGIAATEN